MTLHHVIRIEHKATGQGPFQDMSGPAYSVVLEAAEAHCIRWPPPATEDIDTFCLGGCDFVCGVEYFSQLLDWFTADQLKKLLNLGFKIYLHTVPKKLILFSDSGQQVAFRKADIVDTLILHEA